MELRIDLSCGDKEVIVKREQWQLTGSWTDQVEEIRRACEQAIGAFYAGEIGAGRD